MRSRQCRSCKTRIPFNARFCPYCYKPQWWAIMSMAAAVVVLVFFVGGFIAWKSMAPAVTSEQVGGEVPEDEQPVQSMPTWKEAGREEVALPEDTGKEEILVPVIESGALRERKVMPPEMPEEDNTGRMRTVQKREAKTPTVPASTVKTRREKPRSVEARAEKSPTMKTAAEPPSVRERQKEAERERAEPPPVRAEGIKTVEKAVVEDAVPAGGRDEGQNDEGASPAQAQAGGPDEEDFLLPESPIGDSKGEQAPSLEAQTEKSGIMNTETQ